MPHSSSRKNQNDSQLKKCNVNVRRIKVEHLSDEDGWRSTSLDQSACEVPDSLFEPLVKNPVKLELDIPMNVKRIKVEHEDGWRSSLDKSSSEVPDSLFEPLAKNPVKLELDLPMNVKRIKVEHLSDEDARRSSLDKSSCEVPDSLFEPLAKKPVKLELDIPMNVKRIKVEHVRNSLDQSCEIPDSLFEPLAKKPVKLELNNEFACKFCKKVLANSTGLTVHLGKVHKIHRTFNCEQCSLELPSWAMLERHMVSKHHEQKGKQLQKDKILKCPHCDKKFERQCYLANHVNIVHKGKTEKHCCLGCGLQFTSASKLMVHAVFEQKIVKIPCELCQVKTEVKLNCALEKTLKDTGTKAKCKDCTEKNKV